MTDTLSIMEIEKIIKNYCAIAVEIERLRMKGLLPNRSKTAQKAADVLQKEAARRGMSRINRLMRRSRFVEDRIELITDDRERTVLDCLLDGMSIDNIAAHLMLGRTTIFRMKESLLKRLYDSQFDHAVDAG